MSSSPLHDELRLARAKATRLSVYHIGALVSTLTAIRPEQIETRSGVQKHETDDPHALATVLDAIEAARPSRSAERTEYRWKLVFADAGARLLEVYADTSGRWGMIGEQPVRFAHDELAYRLTERYAPAELPALAHRR